MRVTKPVVRKVLRRSSLSLRKLRGLRDATRVFQGYESLELRAMLAVSAGDFNSDGALTVADIELLSAEVRRGANDLAYDLDANKLVNADDRRFWVENIVGTYFGDANLDLRFDSADLVHVFQSNDYEDAFELNSSWDTGDFDGDREFTTGDLVIAFQLGQYEGQVRRRIQVAEVSPANGEEMVSLTREAIVRFDGEVDATTITSDAFYLIANGDRIPGTIRVSPTNRFATFFYDTPLPASTEVRVVLDGNTVREFTGGQIDADGDGVAGGVMTADFRTLPITNIPGTRVWGRVFDSYNKRPDGSNIPAVGVTISLDANPNIKAVTDADGFFELGLQDLDQDGRADGLPAPEFFVHIDGSTAINAPAGTKYATLGKPFHSVPGQRVQLEMDGQPFDVFLPPMAMSDIVPLNPEADTDVGFGTATQEQIRKMFADDPAKAQLIIDTMKVTYPAGSAMNRDGEIANLATVIAVSPDRLPAPLPVGMTPSLVISVQAGTGAGFNLALDQA